jgi:hypothetical protein
MVVADLRQLNGLAIVALQRKETKQETEDYAGRMAAVVSIADVVPMSIH